MIAISASRVAIVVSLAIVGVVVVVCTPVISGRSIARTLSAVAIVGGLTRSVAVTHSVGGAVDLDGCLLAVMS